MRLTGNIDTFLVLSISLASVCLLLFPAAIGGYWLPSLAIFSGLIIFGAAIVLKKLPVIHLSLFFLLLFGWKWSPLWPETLPTGLLVPLLGYILVILLVPVLRKSVNWFKCGALNRKTFLMALAVLALSLPVLYIWALFSDNTIENYVYLFHPRILFIELLLFALLFAIVNSFTQEIIFRGIFQDALSFTLGPGLYTVLIQALVFGLIHSVGIPSGIMGIIMAFAYGCMLGVLRNFSGGLLLPVIVHFITDLFIFYLIFYKASLQDLLDTFPLL